MTPNVAGAIVIVLAMAISLPRAWTVYGVLIWASCWACYFLGRVQ